MNLRAWKYEDIFAIAELEKQYFAGEAWNYRMLAESFESDNFIGVICEDEGRIAGYGCITVNYDTADIDNIAVIEECRGNGFAAAMLEELVRSAGERGAKKVFLEVRVSNVAAMKLYLAHGFKGLHARLRYYPDGEDCLVMVRTIASDAKDKK